MRKLSLWLWLVASNHLTGQPTKTACDEGCLGAWLKAELRSLDSFPTEVQLFELQQRAEGESEVAKVKLLVEAIQQLLPELPEPYPVRNFLPLTDSEAGFAARLSFQQPNRLSAHLSSIKALFRIDPRAAVREMLEWSPPNNLQQSWDRDEVASLRPFFDLVLDFTERLTKLGLQFESNRLLVKAVTLPNSLDNLADLHIALNQASRTSRIAPPLLQIYIAHIRRMKPTYAPHPSMWAPVLTYWRSLLQGEMKESREELLEAIAQLLTSIPAHGEWIYTLESSSGPITTKKYWPDGARRFWDGMIADIEYSKEEQITLQRVTAQIFNTRADGNLTVRKRSLMWARPEAKEFEKARAELGRDFAKLQPIGAWEARVNGYLRDIRNYNPKCNNDTDRILTFLERHSLWRHLLALSPYQGPQTGVRFDPDEGAREARKRLQHSAKETILRDAIASLESEEGRWVYGYRRLFFFGIWKLYWEEIEESQPELKDKLKRLAAVSSNDIIRYYGTH